MGQPSYFLWTIGETQPQAIYSAFFNGFKNKLIYFQSFETSIAAVTGGHICNDKEKVLISLPTRYGELVISVFHQTGEIEFMNSSKITSELKTLIKPHSSECDIHEGNLRSSKLK